MKLELSATRPNWMASSLFILWVRVHDDLDRDRSGVIAIWAPNYSGCNGAQVDLRKIYDVAASRTRMHTPPTSV